MKAIQWIIAAATLACAQPVQAAVGDPEAIIYRVSGVVDDNNVLATSFHCTNFSGVTETVRVVVRSSNTTLRANIALPVPHLNTIIFSTHHVTVYGDIPLATDIMNGGTAAIAATSPNITCTAMQIQTNSTIPVGIALHMTRFNPIPATQE
jgi:hypothetical protein